MFYAYSAPNKETLYGYTRDPKIAWKYLEILNRDREINLYEIEPLGEEIEKEPDVVFDDDTTLDSLEEWDEWERSGK